MATAITEDSQSKQECHKNGSPQTIDDEDNDDNSVGEEEPGPLTGNASD